MVAGSGWKGSQLVLEDNNIPARVILYYYIMDGGWSCYYFTGGVVVCIVNNVGCGNEASTSTREYGRYVRV